MARKLKEKMKMPSKRADEMAMDEELSMDLADLELPEDELAEEDEDLDLADLEEGEEEMPSPLEDISDEELMAEFEARGLSIEAEEADEEEDEMDEDELA